MSKPRNIEELIAWTRHDNSLTRGQRKVRLSHLKRLCEVVGRIPTMVVTDVAIVRDLMSKANPGASGVSQEYWAKIRSGVWGAMEAADFPVVRARGVDGIALLYRRYHRNLDPRRPGPAAMHADRGHDVARGVGVILGAELGV